jgi:cytolysin (calcineurin-like family phosphatase)
MHPLDPTIARWSSREATAFARAIAGWNVVAIVHGHTHACVFYQWDLSNVTGYKYDLYNAPALQKGGWRACHILGPMYNAPALQKCGGQSVCHTMCTM